LLVLGGQRARGGPRLVEIVFDAGKVGAKFFSVTGGWPCGLRLVGAQGGKLGGGGVEAGHELVALGGQLAQGRGRGRRDVLGAGEQGAALLEPAVALSELLGRHLVGQRGQLFAGGAALGGEAEPHEGFDTVGVRLVGVGVSQAEVVLGDAVALLRLGAEGGKVTRIGGKGGDGESEENRQGVMELGRGMRHGGEAV
jgi:hypothetical protein